MSLKIKFFILCTGSDAELGDPLPFSSLEMAYKKMESQYNERLEGESGYLEDETYIYDRYAIITTNNWYVEWSITESELEISNLQEFASLFENLFGSCSEEFKQFVSDTPEEMKIMASLSEKMLELKNLLTTALPKSAVNKGGDENV